MKKVLAVSVFVIGLAIYLNIGWALGTYYHNNIDYIDRSELKTIPAKFWAGSDLLPMNTAGSDTPESQRMSLLEEQVISSIIWPLFVITTLISWVIKIISIVFTAFLWLLKLIFWGGLARLLGLA